MKKIKLEDEKESACVVREASEKSISKLRPEQQERNSHEKISGNKCSMQKVLQVQRPWGESVLCSLPFTLQAGHVMSDRLTATFLEQIAYLSRVEYTGNDDLIEEVYVVMGILRAQNPKRVGKCHCCFLGARTSL